MPAMRNSIYRIDGQRIRALSPSERRRFNIAYSNIGAFVLLTLSMLLSLITVFLLYDQYHGHKFLEYKRTLKEPSAAVTIALLFFWLYLSYATLKGWLNSRKSNFSYLSISDDRLLIRDLVLPVGDIEYLEFDPMMGRTYFKTIGRDRQQVTGPIAITAGKLAFFSEFGRPV